MKRIPRTCTLTAVAAALVLAGAPLAASASDNFTVTFNATVNGSCKFNTSGSDATITVANSGSAIDPSSTTDATGSGVVKYWCTKGQAPSFQYTVGSGSASATAPTSITLSCSAGNCNGTADSMTTGLTWTLPSPTTGQGFGSGKDLSINIDAKILVANFQNAQKGGPYTNTVKIDVTP